MYPLKTHKKSLFSGNAFKLSSVFLLILIAVLIFSFSDRTRGVMSDLFVPFFKFGGYFYEKAGKLPVNLSSRSGLIKENQRLSGELEKIRLDLADHESIKYENQKLRETLGLKPAGNFAAVSVISRAPQIPLDSLLLGGGALEGLEEGNLVLAGERLLVGKIANVSSNTATVALNSLAGSLTFAYVDRTEESLEIKGGGGNIEARVPIDFDILAGDKIMLAGSLNYLAAVVGAVEEDRSAGFKNVLMSLPVDISKVNTVFVRPF